MSVYLDPKNSSVYPQPPKRDLENEGADKVRNWVGESEIFSTLAENANYNHQEGTSSSSTKAEGYVPPPAYSPDAYVYEEGYAPPPAYSPDAYFPEEGSIEKEYAPPPAYSPEAYISDELPSTYEPGAYRTDYQAMPEYSSYIPVSEQYDSVRDASLIDYSNPLERLTEEPSLTEKIGQTVTDAAAAAQTAANDLVKDARAVAADVSAVAADVVAIAGPAVATAATAVATAATTVGAATVAVGKPVGQFALGLLKGAGSLLFGAATGIFREDPAVTRYKRELQDRIEILYAQYTDIECDQMDYEIREITMTAVPALTGLVFGGVPGALLSGALGLLSGKMCRAYSRTLPQYAAKAARSAQIQAEIRNLSARLGQKAPRMRQLFQ